MSEPSPQTPQAAPSGRIDLVDLARGAALLAMVVFHVAYDLSFFGVIETDVPGELGWRWFARAIAGSFLTLAGISLVLATRDGLNRRAHLRRLAMVAGAAGLVTAGTWLAMPGNFIFFGILHHVALASLLALPFLRLPPPALALAAACVFALPGLAPLPALDQVWLAWLGFSRQVPPTADFVPVFPWFGCVLAGMALARLALPLLSRTGLAGWRAASRPARLLVWAGRRSLAVYLIHQPVLIGLIVLALQAAPQTRPEERAFMLSCQRSCTGDSLGAAACQRLCACSVEALKRDDLWRKALDDTFDPAERARAETLARACLRP